MDIVFNKTFFKYLEGGEVEITATYPAGKIGTTLENLEAAAKGENERYGIYVNNEILSESTSKHNFMKHNFIEI